MPAPSPSLAPGAMSSERLTLRGLAGVDVRAHIAEAGEGVPIVFLHGLAGLNDHWGEVVRRISHRVRCILLELPLLQLTGDDCSVQGVTALTVEFLLRRHNPRLGQEPAVLVGNSFGGHVAARIAVERPDLTRGLVLAGSSGLVETSIVKDLQLRPTREWMERKIGELFYDRAHMRPEDVDRALRELGERSGAKAMVKLSRTSRRNHLGDELSGVTAPTLIVWGREDVVTPPTAAEEFHARIPGSRLVWFDRCGHAPMIEKPDQFAAALLEFVERAERAGAGRRP